MMIKIDNQTSMLATLYKIMVFIGDILHSY